MYWQADANAPLSITPLLDLPDRHFQWQGSVDGVIALRATEDVPKRPNRRDTLQKDYVTTGWSLVCGDAPNNLEQHWRPMNLFEVIFPSNIRNLCKRMHRFQEIKNLGFLIESPNQNSRLRTMSSDNWQPKIGQQFRWSKDCFRKNSGHGPSVAPAMASFHYFSALGSLATLLMPPPKRLVYMEDWIQPELPQIIPKDFLTMSFWLGAPRAPKPKLLHFSTLLVQCWPIIIWCRKGGGISEPTLDQSGTN